MSRPSLHLSVSAHVSASTPVSVHLHPEDNRVVVTVGDESGWPHVDFYLHRPELVGFVDTLSVAIADLDAAVRALGEAPGPTDTSTEHPGGPGQVHNSAA